MNGTLIRYRLLNTIADLLLVLWRYVITWRGQPTTPLTSNERLLIEQDISHLITELSSPITPNNKTKVLQDWLVEWYETPKEHDEEWWSEFEDDLRTHRVSFREPE